MRDAPAALATVCRGRPDRGGDGEGTPARRLRPARAARGAGRLAKRRGGARRRRDRLLAAQAMSSGSPGGHKPMRTNLYSDHEETRTLPANTTNPRSRWIALYVLCVGVLMIVLDATIVNVALPTIQKDLAFSQSSLAWVVNAYLIAFGGLLLLAGRLGDLISRRGVFLAGLGVFSAASLLCGLAQSQELLVGARFVQGIGGAMASAVVLGMIVTMFPEPREQAKAIGTYAFVASAGASVGLLAGGIITEAINWHWIFFVNVPIGIAVALMAVRLVEDRQGLGLDQGADVPGAVLITSGLMLGVYTILDGGSPARTIVLGAMSVGLLGAFVAR